MASEFDLDALQAQIDRSMALTNSLVTSWLPPSLRSGKAFGDSQREAERALQELSKRPSRYIYHSLYFLISQKLEC